MYKYYSLEQPCFSLAGTEDELAGQSSLSDFEKFPALSERRGRLGARMGERELAVAREAEVTRTAGLFLFSKTFL